MSEKRIAFIGPREYADAMRFAGFQCFSVSGKEEAQGKIEQLEKEEYALIFVAQDVCPDEIGLGRVVSLPGIAQAKDENYLKEEIVKALGGEYEL